MSGPKRRFLGNRRNSVRFGRPGEFGALACFLASAASSYISGADLPLDDGGTAG
jgi:NAD(P)-dependent dehydrogenase (short-subunit alcohol dehydrogenase family)